MRMRILRGSVCFAVVGIHVAPPNKERVWVDGKGKMFHDISMAIVALILSLLTLIFAIWLKEMGMKIFEESHYFKLLVGIALLLLIIGIVLVKFFIAPVQGPANIGSLWSAFNELTASASDIE